MERDRDLDVDTTDEQRPSPRRRRQIDCGDEPRWIRQPEIVVRQRVTIVEPLPEREQERHR